MADVRPIDANALPMHKVKIVHAFGIVEGSVVFPDDIKKAPTVDAVPVVRCKECEFCEKFPISVYCIMWNSFTKINGFCHKGEKLDGGAE